jgi:hypothetical protein
MADQEQKISKIDIAVSTADTGTILAYLKSVNRKRGYQGAVFCSTKRLIDLHMPSSVVWARAAINKAQITSKR